MDESIRKGCDACEPCRKGFNRMAESLASNKISTTVFTVLPMISMIIALIYFETSFSSVMFNNYVYNLIHHLLKHTSHERFFRISQNL